MYKDFPLPPFCCLLNSAKIFLKITEEIKMTFVKIAAGPWHRTSWKTSTPHEFCQSFLAGSISVCSTPHGKPQVGFTEKLVGFWEHRSCSVYEIYLQILEFQTGNQ